MVPGPCPRKHRVLQPWALPVECLPRPKVCRVVLLLVGPRWAVLLLVALVVECLLVECPLIQWEAHPQAVLQWGPLREAPLLWQAAEVSPWVVQADCPLAAPLPQWQEGCHLSPHPTGITGAKAQPAALPPPLRPHFAHSEEIDQILREQLDELFCVIFEHADDCRCKNCRKYDKVQLILLEIFD